MLVESTSKCFDAEQFFAKFKVTKRELKCLNRNELEKYIAYAFRDQKMPLAVLMDYLIHDYKWVEKDKVENYNLLQLACRYGRLEAVKEFVKAGWDANVMTFKEYTLLHIAGLNGQLHVAEWLLQAGADINAANPNWSTPLSVTIRAGQLEVADFLMQQKGIDLTGGAGHHCLSEAAEHCHIDTFNKLLELGVDPLFEDQIIFHFVRSKNYEMTEKMIQMGAKTDGRFYSKYAGTIFDVALENNDMNMFELFKKHNITRNPEGRTLYDPNALTEHFEFILENGLYDDINRRDHRGRTVLMNLAKVNRLDAFKLFLKYGADLNLTDENGKNVIHYAAEFGKLELVEYFVTELKLDINSRDLKGKTVLHHNKMDGALGKQFMKKMIELGADINVLDNEKRTPLHWAVIDEEVNKIDDLLFYGARSDIFDSKSQRPFDLCSFWSRDVKRVFSKYKIYRFTLMDELLLCL